MIVGVGARPGVSADEVDALIGLALAEAGADRASVASLATVEARAGEPGLVEVARRHGWPVVAYPATELAAETVPNPSAATAAAVGTPSVAEAAALRAARDAGGDAGGGVGLLVAKRAGVAVTVAIAHCGQYAMGGTNVDHRLEVGSVELGEFWRERRLCTLTTLRADGTPHVVPVGATLDGAAGVARVIASRGSSKVGHVLAAGADGAPVAVCQVDGRRWSTVEGRAVVRDDADSVRDAERRYAERYRQPRRNPDRVVIEIRVTRVLGNV
jgi:PPOX class probable F420-dependent enzyme